MLYLYCVPFWNALDYYSFVKRKSIREYGIDGIGC
jgi:hypothetical protein